MKSLQSLKRPAIGVASVCRGYAEGSWGFSEVHGLVPGWERATQWHIKVTGGGVELGKSVANILIKVLSFRSARREGLGMGFGV